MPVVAMALIFSLMVLAVWLIGILWAIALLIRFYAYIGLAVYLVWRSKRKHAELAASLERDAERKRQFNEQEMRAWRDPLENDGRNASRRDRALRSFDRTRDPPQT
jgi:hypothetical protein